MSPHDRTRCLLKLADLIEQHVDELTELVALEGGKPLGEGRGEVLTSAARFVYCAGWATKIYGETNPSVLEMFNYTIREPVGVCGQITSVECFRSSSRDEMGAGSGVRQYSSSTNPPSRLLSPLCAWVNWHLKRAFPKA